MNKEVKIFNPSIAEANKIVEQYKGLKIKDVEDKDGYLAVYNGIQELKKLRGDITKDEILSLDEKQFSEMYSVKKQEFDDEIAKLKQEEEDKKKRNEEIKEAERLSALRATEEAERKAKEELARVEREKQAEIDKMKREQEEKERLEAERIEKERMEKEEAERNVKYQNWLSKNGYTEEQKENFLIQKNGNEYVLYKKLDVINL